MSVITQQRLKEVFTYDEGENTFRWVAGPAKGDRYSAGDLAGYVTKNGYWSLGLDGDDYQVHRLIWLWHTGRFPDGQIDHRNGNRSDNRFANLREASNAENAQNKKNMAGKSGFRGVTRLVKNSKWMAQITADGRHYYLGSYDDIEDAHAAYLAAKARLHTFQPVPRELVA